MSIPLHVADQNTAVALNDLLRDHGGGLLNSRGDPRTGRTKQDARPGIAFVLLEDLESGGSARALLLHRSWRPVQIVTLRGTVTNGTFRLHYGAIDGSPEADKTSGAIAFNATAAEMAAALEEMEALGSGDVSVTLGKVKVLNEATGLRETITTGRWFVEFLSELNPPTLQAFEDATDSLSGTPHLITVETHFLVATDKVETIYATTPVSDPTPQRRGAIGTAKWLHAIGYSVSTIECHALESTQTTAS